nr:hypothetical protein Iba_chr02fCG7310 [Ipomoea batatas]
MAHGCAQFYAFKNVRFPGTRGDQTPSLSFLFLFHLIQNLLKNYSKFTNVDALT